MSISRAALPVSVVFASLVAAAFCYATGTLNLHYDGVAHLNIARRIFDHPVPHYSHLGTVWLPLQHLLLLPWVQSDFLWSQGLAGTLVSASAFWGACYYLFRLSLLVHSQRESALLAVGAFVLNPNILYLQSTPLGEMLYIALFLAAMYYLIDLAERPRASVLPAAGAALLASLTRYDGWLIAPWGALLLLPRQFLPRKDSVPQWSRAFRYVLIASLGIVGWLVYNQVAFEDPLSFVRGDYSTRQNIHRIVSESGLAKYPPVGSPLHAVRYYGQAVFLSAGGLLVFLAFLGFAHFARQNFPSRKFWVIGFCFLFPPVFYIANLVRGTGIIYVPELPPYGILNVRYTGLFIPGLCLFFPAGVACLSRGLGSVAGSPRAACSDTNSGRWKTQTRLGWVVLGCLSCYWIARAGTGSEAVAFYEEARVNGLERKQTDFQAAAFLRARYDGKRILMDLSQHGIIPQQCRIRLLQIVNESTDWAAALALPSSHADWIVVQEGDGVWRFPVNWEDVRRQFELVFEAETPLEKPLLVYRKRP